MASLAPLVLVLSILCSFAKAQTPARVRWLPKPESGRPGTEPWMSLLTTPTLAVGRYSLAKGATDQQSPHGLDEVYHVLSGKAKLQAGDETRAVSAGDTVFVAARTSHHFVEIETDLEVLVFFSSAHAATGGMAAAPPPTKQTPFPETSQRGNTRIFYWFGPDSAGQVAIDYGRPRWQPAFTKFVDQPSAKRWRLGENFWTTLDTNMPLTLGGVDIGIGQYYAVLQNTKEAGPQLVLLDPGEVRKRRLDAYEATKTTGGLVVPLRASLLEEPTTELEVELAVDPATGDTGTLTIRFGPHVMTAALRMHPHRG